MRILRGILADAPYITVHREDASRIMPDTDGANDDGMLRILSILFFKKEQFLSLEITDQPSEFASEFNTNDRGDICEVSAANLSASTLIRKWLINPSSN